MSFKKYAIIGAVVLVAIIVLPFIAALLLAIVSTDAQQTARTVGVIRDVVIIVLALEAILIVVALATLIIQVAQLITILRNEVKPILKDAQETVDTAKGTAQFVGKNVTQPLIDAGAFAAGLGVFVRELGGIRRAIRPDRNGREREASSNGR